MCRMEKTKTNRLKTIGCPLLASMIWGAAFVAQRISAGYIGAFSFNAARSTVAALTLGLAAWLVRRHRHGPAPTAGERRRVLRGGALCGALLALAANLQQLGIAETAAGKSGFITTLYIVLVPVLGLLLKQKAPRSIWLSVVIAVLGLYLLCVRDGFSLSGGDLFLLLCALAYALYILAVDRCVQGVEPLELSCVQFAVAAALAWIAALLFEKPAWSQIAACLGQILYVGIFSSAVAYTLQMLAQTEGDPATVSILLSMEAPFSVLAGAVFLQERLSGRELAGCAVMLCAVLLTQLAPGWGKKRREKARSRT